MELTGKLIFVGEIQQIREFLKREFVIETNEQYPQKIVIELQGERIDLLEPYKIEETLKVSINLRGKAYQDKNGQTRYFNTLVAWKIQR